MVQRRSIPIFIFMNDQFEQVSVWGPRAREAQEFVTQLRAEKLPPKDAHNYEDKEKKYIMKSLLNINQILTYGIKFMTL